MTKIYIKNPTNWLTIGWIQFQASGWWKGFSYRTCKRHLCKSKREAETFVKREKT